MRNFCQIAQNSKKFFHHAGSKCHNERVQVCIDNPLPASWLKIHRCRFSWALKWTLHRWTASVSARMLDKWWSITKITRVCYRMTQNYSRLQQGTLTPFNTISRRQLVSHLKRPLPSLLLPLLLPTKLAFFARDVDGSIIGRCIFELFLNTIAANNGRHLFSARLMVHTQQEIPLEQ